MKYIVFFIMIVTFFGCGGGTDTIQAISTNSDGLSNLTQKENPSKTTKTLTLYIHGYAKDGYKRPTVYGKDSQEAELSGIIQTTGFDTTQNYDKEQFKNLFAIASYYGDTPPSYYSQQDTQAVESMPKGIPRYALIMAKYAKYMMQESGAKQLNIVSVSMGSLVSRYLIEKDLEHLSSEKKIQKWLSFEGVIKGNIAASSDRLLDFVESFERQSPDVAQMDYDWINTHLDEQNPYYKEIQIAFESSTKDSANKGALSTWLRLNGNFRANDGVQLVRDTYFSDSHLSQTYFHDNHYTLADNKAAWGYAATFLTSNKRVRLTLLDATLYDLHEDDVLFQSILPADIVFESSVHAPKAEKKWGFERAVDERLLKAKALKVYDFYKEGVAQNINLTLFDSTILPQEKELLLTLTPFELDAQTEYGVRELTGHGAYESLEEKRVSIPVKEGIYPLQSAEWSGHVKVDILP